MTHDLISIDVGALFQVFAAHCVREGKDPDTTWPAFWTDVQAVMAIQVIEWPSPILAEAAWMKERN